MAMVIVVAVAFLLSLGVMPWQTGEADSSVLLNERGIVAPLLNSGLDGRQGASDEAQPNYLQSSGEDDRDAQRQRAIEQQNPAVLPACTDEELTSRPNPAPAKSMNPWDHPDQVGGLLPTPRPDQMVPGPPSEQGPVSIATWNASR